MKIVYQCVFFLFWCCLHCDAVSRRRVGRVEGCSSAGSATQRSLPEGWAATRAPAKARTGCGSRAGFVNLGPAKGSIGGRGGSGSSSRSSADCVLYLGGKRTKQPPDEIQGWIDFKTTKTSKIPQNSSKYYTTPLSIMFYNVVYCFVLDMSRTRDVAIFFHQLRVFFFSLPLRCACAVPTLFFAVAQCVRDGSRFAHRDRIYK